MERTRAYRDGRVVAEGFPLAEVDRKLADPKTDVWLDLLEPSAAELRALPEEFGLHELAIRAATTQQRRPSLARYPDHLFLNASTVRVDRATLTVEAAEVAAFVTPRALITIRKDGRFDIDAVLARWDTLAPTADGGVKLLVYGLLDHVVDSHFAAVQDLDESIEQVEDLLFQERPPNAEVQRRAYALRKCLLRLRRLAVPTREVVLGLMRWEQEKPERDLLPYYQDLYDQVLRVAEWTESQRELVATILESNLTVQGNQLSLIMKRVTGWAAIIGVPTAVTGFYGMNVPYPGSGTFTGMIGAVVLLAASSVGLYALFRHLDWL
jgi:magnesium transporter